MDWVKEFYSCQNDWFGVYLTDINQSHQDRVDLINSAINQPHSKVLELGAGGGQTAVALAKQGYQVTMIELLQRSVQHAHKLNDIHQQSVKIIQGDFYQYSTSDQFDIVCYFDSFGIFERIPSFIPSPAARTYHCDPMSAASMHHSDIS